MKETKSHKAILENGGTIKETRKCKITIGKPGGNASKGAKNYRLSLPTNWMNEMEITPDDRNVKISFDGKKITVEKIEDEEARSFVRDH